MNISFLTDNLNNVAKLYQNEKFTIPDEDIIKAIVCINNLEINSSLDCLLFLSSLNLCNAYVKQNPDGLTYTFKKGISYLINILNNKKIDNVKINIISEHGRLYLFQIGNIQYSFHNDMNIDVDSFYRDNSIKWDKIKKQPVAILLFNQVLKEKLSNIDDDTNANDLDMIIQDVLDRYRNKEEGIGAFKRIKI